MPGPIRHADHVHPYATGGSTALTNAAGLCESCNYLKQAPGWRTEIINPHTHTIRITTPTGHRYHTQPPATPGHQPHTLHEHIQRTLDDADDNRPGPTPNR